MTLNGVMALILRYFTEFVYDVVVKKFTFAIASPDEFLVSIAYTVCLQNVCKRLMFISQSTVARWLYCVECLQYNIRSKGSAICATV